MTATAAEDDQVVEFPSGQLDELQQPQPPAACAVAAAALVECPLPLAQQQRPSRQSWAADDSSAAESDDECQSAVTADAAEPRSDTGNHHRNDAADDDADEWQSWPAAAEWESLSAEAEAADHAARCRQHDQLSAGSPPVSTAEAVSAAFADAVRSLPDRESRCYLEAEAQAGRLDRAAFMALPKEFRLEVAGSWRLNRGGAAGSGGSGSHSGSSSGRKRRKLGTMKARGGRTLDAFFSRASR